MLTNDSAGLTAFGTPAIEIAIEEPNNSVRLARLFLIFHRSGVEIPTTDAGNPTYQVVDGMAIFASELALLITSGLQLPNEQILLLCEVEAGKRAEVRPNRIATRV